MRRFKVNRKRAKIRKDQRIARLLHFYQERTQQALEDGVTYMPSPTVSSLETMVAYRFPKLSERTRRSYAEVLFAKLAQTPNKCFLRDPFSKSTRHRTRDDTL